MKGKIMNELHKKDIEIYKKEIERLYKKIDYLEELDRKNMLSIIKMQRVITDYETNFIEYHKYEELQNDYINLVQVLNNKNKKANNE
jgi:ArsR family metal-binding transcriptional regulator